MTGVDKQKDQSYFLCNTPSSLLKNVYFPVGSMHKSEVKRLAAKVLTRSFTYLLTYLLTHLLTHSLTNSLTHSLTYLLTLGTAGTECYNEEGVNGLVLHWKKE
jgi:hypothetical protein